MRAGPPRLVLRFAVYTAFALALAAAGLLWFAHRYATGQAESAVRFHARFVAHTILRDHLRPPDLEAPVDRALRSHLDRLFRRQVLVSGAVRVKLWNGGGLITYSNDHTLIGTRVANEHVGAALGGSTVSTVSRLNRERAAGETCRCLRPTRRCGFAPQRRWESSSCTRTTARWRPLPARPSCRSRSPSVWRSLPCTRRSFPSCAE